MGQPKKFGLDPHGRVQAGCLGAVPGCGDRAAHVGEAACAEALDAGGAQPLLRSAVLQQPQEGTVDAAQLQPVTVGGPQPDARRRIRDQHHVSGITGGTVQGPRLWSAPPLGTPVARAGRNERDRNTQK
jgi:hypothetical protein